jgi:tRNA U34 5-carboxymethylaminomethyl modifying enzyme MnmG/GidA
LKKALLRVRTLGVEIRAKSVVLTNGTFLNGLIHIGEQFGEVEQEKVQRTELPKI